VKALSYINPGKRGAAEKNKTCKEEMATLIFYYEVWPTRHVLQALAARHWSTCKYHRQAPFKRSPLVYKGSFCTYHVEHYWI